MITDIAHHIIQGIHRLVDRVQVAGFQALGSHIVSHWAALDDVTVIDQYAVGHLLASVLDQAGGAHQAEFIGGLILVIVEVHHIAV
ncbi:hypothetical protein D3C75_1200650 [compost metagenome]